MKMVLAMKALACLLRSESLWIDSLANVKTLYKLQVRDSE
jgi:hypothetical protein